MKDLFDEFEDFENDPKTLEEAINNSLDEEEQEVETPEVTQEAAPEVTEDPEVVKAKKNGHLSKEDYVKKYGTEEGYKSPEEFNKFGDSYSEVRDTIKSMQRSLSERDKQIEALVRYNDRVEQRAKEKALRDIELDLQRAKENMDVEAVHKLSEVKLQAQQEAVHEQIKRYEEERQSELRSFQERNKHWFNINPVMTERAKQIDQEEQLNANRLGIVIPVNKLAEIIEARLRTEFPEVMIRNTSSAPVVSSVQSAVNRTAGDPVEREFTKLDGDHLAIFKATNNMLRRQGIKEYSKKEFVEKLKREGEI